MRILPPLAVFSLFVALPAQATCSASPGPATTLWTMNPFAGTHLYGHPNYPTLPGPTFPGFSYLIDTQNTVDIAISRIDLDLYDAGGQVTVSSTVTVTSPNQVGATAPVTVYLYLGPTWVGQETTPAAWSALGVGTLTVAPPHTDSQVVFSPPIVLPSGNWAIAVQVPQTTNGPNPGPLHPMVTPTTTPSTYVGPAFTMTNVMFQRESWTNSLTSPGHTQSLEFHYQPLTGYANFTSFGTGCGTPTVPQLGLTQAPVIGTAIAMRTSNIVATSALSFWLLGFTPDATGTSLAPYGLPGCTAYLQVASPIITSVSPVTAGVATLQLALPNDPSFSGVVLFAQAAPIAGSGSLAFHASNAICVAIGLY